MSIIDQSPIDLDEADSDDIPPHPGRKLTEEEFIEWSGRFWAEWIDGEVIMMSVNRDHAYYQDFLSRLLGQFVEQRDLGVTRTEPFQVRLAKQRRRRMPDIFFIAKNRIELIHNQGFEGAPDLVMEILSAESQSRDWRVKFEEYELAGVREYWVVDPATGIAEAYVLKEATFSRIAETDGKIPSTVLAGFYLRPAWLKHHPLPRVHDVLSEFGI